MGTEAWTYYDVGQVRMTGDLTLYYWNGMKVKLSQGGSLKYFVITDVTVDVSYTYLTLDGHDLYTLENAAIASHYVSIDESPYGFPVFADVPDVSDLLISPNPLMIPSGYVKTVFLKSGETYTIPDGSVITGRLTIAEVV